MKFISAVLVMVVILLIPVAASRAWAQSNDDLANLDKCVGYEACKKIQDKIDAIKAGAGNVADKVSNALTPSDNRSYYEKFTLEERMESVAQCQKNFAGGNCETGRLTPEEIEKLHPKKAAPPLSPEVVRAREREQLARDDNSVAAILDSKCFTPQMANGLNYGDCADALTRLNLLEKSAKALGLPLRSSALAQQFGFPRNADGSWNDRYAQAGAPQPAPRSASASNDAAAIAAEAKVRCQIVNACTHEELQAAIIMSRSILAMRCANIDSCTQAEVNAMTFEESVAFHRWADAAEKTLQLTIADFVAGRPSVSWTPPPVQSGYRGAQTAVQNAGSSASGGSDINGEWVGQSSGNRVKLEVRPDGIFGVPVTQNIGQAQTGYLFRESGAGTYQFQFPDGKYAVMQILGPDQIRTTNPDGWTDVFKRAGPSSSRQTTPAAGAGYTGASAGRSSTSAAGSGQCVGSSEYCWGVAHGCDYAKDIECSRAYERDRRQRAGQGGTQ